MVAGNHSGLHIKQHNRVQVAILLPLVENLRLRHKVVAWEINTGEYNTVPANSPQAVTENFSTTDQQL